MSKEEERRGKKREEKRGNGRKVGRVLQEKRVSIRISIIDFEEKKRNETCERNMSCSLPDLHQLFSLRKGIFSCNDSFSPFSKNMPQSIPFLVFCPLFSSLDSHSFFVFKSQSRDPRKAGTIQRAIEEWSQRSSCCLEENTEERKNAKQLHSSESFEFFFDKNSSKPVVVKESQSFILSVEGTETKDDESDPRLEEGSFVSHSSYTLLII